MTHLILRIWKVKTSRWCSWPAYRYIDPSPYSHNLRALNTEQNSNLSARKDIIQTSIRFNSCLNINYCRHISNYSPLDINLTLRETHTYCVLLCASLRQIVLLSHFLILSLNTHTLVSVITFNTQYQFILEIILYILTVALTLNSFYNVREALNLRSGYFKTT